MEQKTIKYSTVGFAAMDQIKTLVSPSIIIILTCNFPSFTHIIFKKNYPVLKDSIPESVPLMKVYEHCLILKSS